MLIYFGVTPYLVFDGDNLPSKACTESERAKRREESKRRGLELYKAGKVSQAYPEFQKAVDVTPYMARQLIEELKKMSIQYVVAPYEADAQLAYLEKKGIVDGILSEDSDLLVYGAKRLITKLDQHGDCIEISRSDFASCRDMTLAGFTDADFRLMAILSGCDYLPSINKVGLKTAHTYVRKYKHVEKILRILQFEQKFTVPNGYLEKFYEAERTFLHHRIFCPLEKKLLFLTELGDGVKAEDMPYLGENVSPATTIGVACGDLDPMTKKPILVKVAASSRSMPELHHRQTLTSANKLKPIKSIDNFFKPKRQPLAELDPNSLTPSPSQQRLLDIHRNASWEARPVSSAPQLRRSASVLQGQDHAQKGAVPSTERSSFLERAATLSTFQPPKRTRLCSDVDISPSEKGGRSPFFADTPNHSPSVRKSGKIKRARRSDIDIFSDDSIAGAFEEMKESDSGYIDTGIASVGKSDNSQSSTSKDLGVTTNSVTEVCDTPIRQSVVILHSELSQTTPAVSADTKDDPEEFQDLVETHAKQLNDLRNTFAYQSPERQAAALRGLSPPITDLEYTKQEQSRGEKRLTESVVPRSNQGAAIQTQAQHASSLDKTFGRQSLCQQTAALSSLGQTQTEAQKVKLALAALDTAPPLEIERKPGTPLQQLRQQALQNSSASTCNGGVSSSVSRPEPTDTAARSERPISKMPEVNVHGSEDLLVPNSEDEASEFSEVDESRPVKRAMDLTRFAFTANA